MAPIRKKGTRSIGIDFGMARIGIAVSDETKIIAMKLMTLKTESKTEKTIDKLLLEIKKHQESLNYEVDVIVIGMPLMMSGKTGFLADEVKNFIALMQKVTTIPLATWDERLTSVQADRSMRESNMTRKERSKLSDTVAAVIILQNYLDHKKIQSLRQEDQK
jgi:putative Holliday junction resolvase